MGIHKSIVCAGFLFLLNGCASLFGDFRQGLDDDQIQGAPTVGGMYPEGRFLDGADSGKNYYDESGRFIASENQRDGQSWVNGDSREPNYGDVQNLPPQVKREYRNGDRATRKDFVDNGPNEASLWAPGGQTNYYFTKNRVRQSGDIVGLTLSEDLVANIAAEVKKTLTEDEYEAEMEYTQRRIEARAKGLPEPSPYGVEGADKAKAPAKKGKEGEQAEIDVPDASYQDIDLTKSLQIKPGDQVMAEIIQRYPNGNYKVRANKRVPYRGTMKSITVEGIASSAEVEEQKEIDARKLYEYRVVAYP